MLLLDVTPLTLGIETMGGVMTPIVEANTTIPCTKSQIFTTAEDNQPAVTISVLQGNRPMAKDDKQIGLFNLDGIMPAPRGTVQIEVSFDINANGILNVSAKDKATGKEQHITIESRGGLSDDEVERMKKEAEQYAEEDKKERERIENLNSADSYAFMIEKAMKDMPDGKLTEEQKTSVTEKISLLREAVKSGDAESSEARRKELEDVWNPIMGEMYQSQSGGTQGNPFNSDGNPFGNFAGPNPFSKK